ncbi:S53 family peptidase [Solimicrobium silvestre]|nr:S53 family peptidase [Solimicrobium silvestre]
MTINSVRSVIPGTNRIPMRNAQVVGPIPENQIIEITIMLRSEHECKDLNTQFMSGNQSLSKRKILSREEFAKKFGASSADIAKVEAFAQQYNLAVCKVNQAHRSIILSGTVGALNKAFGTTLEQYQHPNGVYFGRIGELSAPNDVIEMIEGVFGLDNRPQASKHFQVRTSTDTIKPSTTFTPPQLAKIYNFPPADATGQCIGIIELGGGTRPADINAYFSGLGITAPNVIIVPVDSATDQPSTPAGADGEVMLDIEVAGAIAPGATIAVYFAPNTDRGFLDAVTTAIHDAVNKPSVISISWGSAEVAWTHQAMTAFESAFIDAAAMGVTICVAAGDNGSTDGQTDGTQNVDFPASAPHALACGGTSLVINAAGSATETVWNDGVNSATGGGHSSFFPIPAYQTSLDFTQQGRGVPDVAADADPNTGYAVRVDGEDMVIGGTSAVAPLWAGLIALINQQLGHPVGFLNPLLYGALQNKKVTNDITQGNNGAYQAGVGWDACTGWGSPNGQNLLHALD